MRVEIADLGTWGGAWLVAEYDSEDDAIRVNARAVARVRAALGDAEAERFIACAIAHERFHRERPDASEQDARAAAQRACGVEPARFENALRSSRA
jgi:hypothetical protein